MVHVLHTNFHKTQPTEIGQLASLRPDPIPDSADEDQFELHRILSHRKRGRGYQCLTLLKGSPEHEAELQPTPDFVDTDRTVTQAFKDYIVEHGLLQNLH